MNIKADAFCFEGVDQFRSKTRKINAHALNAVIEVWIDCFNNGIAATVIDVDSRGQEGASADS